jgi:hypothetical protein
MANGMASPVIFVLCLRSSQIVEAGPFAEHEQFTGGEEAIRYARNEVPELLRHYDEVQVTVQDQGLTIARWLERKGVSR